VTRVLVIAAIVACAWAAASSPAGATNECKGLQVCVPVIGPWVAAGSGAQVSFQLACPKRYVVAGLDAELSRRGVDVTFRGSLGSPVNPGITTSRSAEFLARELTAGTPATFRPHIGCVPASGGGERYPTSSSAVRPQPALVATAVQISVVPGTHRFVERCRKGTRLTGATHAVGFYTAAPPSAATVESVAVAQSIAAGAVHLVVRAGALPGVKAIVQVDLECA
jgi:hypothetical protein